MNDRRIGTVLGPYRIEAQLGRGGMGTVYRATHIALNRPVALKLLSPALVEEPGFIDRFRREAVLAANLKHPHIVTVHDFGEDGDLLYLVMEYVAGGTLKDKVGGLPDHLLAARLVGQVADALDYAHQHGILHRDVKPANILLERPDFAKLGDFGIARLAEDSQHLTRTGAGIGTPEYLSPEQGQGLRELDGRTDIYSLGIVLFDLLTGEAPFRSSSHFEILRQHVEKPLPVATLLEHGTPPELIQILLKATAKKPEGRYGRAGEMRDALEQFQARRKASSASTIVAAPEPASPPVVAPEPPAPVVSTTVVSGSTEGVQAIAPGMVPPFDASTIVVAPDRMDAAGEADVAPVDSVAVGLTAVAGAGALPPALGWAALAGSRIATIFIATFVVLTGVFFLSRVFSDPTAALGAQPNAATLANLRAALHLDDPLPAQYARVVGDALRGDLGRSLRTNGSALSPINSAWPNTLSLLGVTLIFSALIGLPYAAMSAAGKRRAFRILPRSFATFAQSLPVTEMSLLLVLLFAVKYRALPGFGFGRPEHFVMPVLVLATLYFPAIVRIGRAIGEVRRGDAGPNHRLLRAVGSVFSIGILEIGALFSALIVVENTFAWPGVGRLLITAALTRDFPVVIALAIELTAFLAILIVVGGLPKAFADPTAPSVALFADDYRALGIRRDEGSAGGRRILRWLPFAALALVFLALLAVSVAPLGDPLRANIIQRLQEPAAGHLLGTDQLGRDVLTRVLAGVRQATIVAFGAVIPALIGGGFAGLLAGGAVRLGFGWIAAPVVWIATASRSVPLLVWMIAGAATVGTSTTAYLLLFCVWLWPVFFALVAGLVIDLPETNTRTAVRRSLATFAGGFAFAVGSVLLADGMLSFLGLGVPPPTPTLGGMLGDAREYIQNAYWLQSAGVALVIIVLTFNLLGDTLAGVLRIRRPL